MAKISKEDALARWHAAESQYSKVVALHTDDKSVGKLTKSDAVEIMNARVKADQRMDEYFHRCLGERSPRG